MVSACFCAMAAFVSSLPSLPTGRHHAISSLSCWHRQQLLVAIVPRRCRPVMTQAVSVEQQRAFDQRMNRMCNEVVRWGPPCICRLFFVGAEGEERTQSCLRRGCFCDAHARMDRFFSSFVQHTRNAAAPTGQDHSARLCRRCGRSSRPPRRRVGRLCDPIGDGVPFPSRPHPH